MLYPNERVVHVTEPFVVARERLRHAHYNCMLAGRVL
jgi:hypothetical protein